MSDVNPIELSSNTIIKLFDHEQKKMINCSLNYQILSTVKMVTPKSDVYTAILSDSTHKYKNFVIKKNTQEPEFASYQIINITILYSTSLKTEKNPVFVVSKYAFISSASTLIGNPINITDDIITSISIIRTRVEDTNTNNKDISQPITQAENKTPNLLTKPPITSISVKPKFPAISSGDAVIRKSVLLVDEKRDIVACPSNAMPLAQLSTFTKDLVVHIRVIKVSELKSYTSKQGGQGCLFSFIIIDKEGTEMQVGCFNKVAEKFSSIVKLYKVYVIKGGFVKVNDKKFNSTKADFKIVLEDKSVMQQVEDNGEIKMFSLDLVKLSDIINMPIKSTVDVMGVVIELCDAIEKQTKNGGEVKMRKIYIVDESLHKMELSLWKANASLEINTNDVLLCKNLKIGDFNGKNVATMEDSQILINPENIPEAEALRELITNYRGDYSTMTSTGAITSVVSQNLDIKFLRDVLDSLNKFNKRGEEDQAQVKVVISNFVNSEKHIYSGCPNNNCKRKLSESVQSQGFYCAECKTFYDKPVYYYNISIIVKDTSCEFWVDVFGNLGDKITGISADEYKKAFVERDDQKLQSIVQRIEYRNFILQIKPKVANFNSTLKKKLQILNIEPVDRHSDFSRMYKSLTFC